MTSLPDTPSPDRQLRRAGTKVGKSIRGQFDCGGTFDRGTFDRRMYRKDEGGRSPVAVAAAGSFGTFGRSFTDSGPPALLVRPLTAKEPPLTPPSRLERAVLDSEVEDSEIASNVYIR